MNNKIITLDVCADIHAGREPFSKIMNAVAQLRADEDLRILAPFEPVPLFELLRGQGFQHTSSANATGDWEVLFTRQPGGKSAAAQPTVPQARGGVAAGLPPEVIELDARGLEPPQPLVTILEALGRLPLQAELCARTDRRPMHLYAQLEARGFTGESRNNPMEVSLPISATAKERRSPTRRVDVEASDRTVAMLKLKLQGEKRTGSETGAPAIKLPLAFMLTGLGALLLGVLWLVAQPSILASYHYNQYVIALTHLFVLGFICSIVMGAMYHLVPVALETKLYSERLARWQFAFHLVGVIGMVWMFWKWDMKQVGHFGTVLTVGVGLFVFNLVRTLRRVPRWNVTATAVTAALFWISLTVIAGLSIATGKCTYESTSGLATVGGVKTLLIGLRSLAGFMSHFNVVSAMHAHAHLGGVGFFTLLIVGVSYKLIPMFTLSEVQSQPRALLSVLLLNVGLVGSFVTILLRSPWKLAFALLVSAALAVYGWELTAILRARKRGPLDWGIRYFLTAVALLIPVSLLSVVLCWPGLPLNPFTGQLENLYGFLGLMGVVSFAIMGMLYKIIPFLVWFGVYSQHVGRGKVPALVDMYSSRLQMIGYWSFLAGLVTISAGILWESENVIRFGSLLFTASVLLLVLNAGKILAHWVRPQVTSPKSKPAGIMVRA